MARTAAAHDERSCEVLARAKLNLSLRVLARETGGFHQIETTLCLIELADELTVSIGGHDIVLDVMSPPEVTGPPPELGPAHANLAWRAATAFLQATGCAGGAHIRLIKRVPVGAGLGGGSSDAAAVLDALNELHGRPLARAALVALAGTLGSDVPFFAAHVPFAMAWGRGGRLAPLTPPPAKPVLLVVPPQQVSTAAAYAAFADARTELLPAAPRLVDTAPSWSTLAAESLNDFEPVIFAWMPELARVRAALLEAGALLARMTGSGSVIFGVFEDERAASDTRARVAAAFPHMRVIATSTVTL